MSHERIESRDFEGQSINRCFVSFLYLKLNWLAIASQPITKLKHNHKPARRRKGNNMVVGARGCVGLNNSLRSPT